MNKLLQAAVALSLLLSTGGQLWAANPETTERRADNWQFVLNFPMLWLPDISGEIDVDGTTIEVDKPISEILEDLDMGFIGEVYARKGPWTFGLRTMYLGTSKDTRTDGLVLPGLPPVIGKHKITVEGDLFTSDLIAVYNFNTWFGLYTGVRRSGMSMDIKTRANQDDPGLIELPRKVEIADEELYDWIGGVSLEYPFGAQGKWRAAVEADTMISGDNDEDYQINAFLAHHFNQRHSIWFGYRYLRLVREMQVDGSTVETDFAEAGPTLGWAFTF